jgi:hypothetical protein
LTNQPYIKVWVNNLKSEMPIIQDASIKRDFLDETDKAHGYHCQPLTTSILHGWDFILPQDVEVIWDGVNDSSSSHIKVLQGHTLPSGHVLVDTLTANGTITFHLNVFIETDTDHFVFLQGPPNYFVNGAKPMTALIRSDWYRYTGVQFCWKITTPNKPILFKKGTPIARIMNYPIGLLEKTNIEISPAPEAYRQATNLYNAERQAFYKANPGKWPLMYKKTKTSTRPDAVPYLQAPYRPSPKKPIINE